MSGFNVYPAEVEEVLAEHPGVAEVAVVGVAHPHTGEAVKAYVVARPGDRLDEEQLIEFCGDHLARYKCPTKVLFVDELPRGLAASCSAESSAEPSAARARTTSVKLREHVHECVAWTAMVEHRPTPARTTTARAGERGRRRIPEATVARLPDLPPPAGRARRRQVDHVSSEQLAELAGVNAAKVRKDLSYLGSYGTRGVGYEVAYLVYQIRRELGLTHDWPVVIVGAGNLGQALAGYGGFGDRGFPVAGVVDIDPAKVGSVIGGTRVRHLDELPQIVQSRGRLDRRDRHPGARRPGCRRRAGARRRSPRS